MIRAQRTMFLTAEPTRLHSDTEARERSIAYVLPVDGSWVTPTLTIPICCENVASNHQIAGAALPMFAFFLFAFSLYM